MRMFFTTLNGLKMSFGDERIFNKTSLLVEHPRHDCVVMSKEGFAMLNLQVSFVSRDLFVVHFYLQP